MSQSQGSGLGGPVYGSQLASATVSTTPSTIVRGSHDVKDFDEAMLEAGRSIVDTMGPPMASVAEETAAAVAAAPPQPSAVVAEPGRAAGDALKAAVAAIGGAVDAAQAAAGVRHGALLAGGLAADDDEQQPQDVLQQIINHRKAMQGIDLNQVRPFANLVSTVCFKECTITSLCNPC